MSDTEFRGGFRYGMVVRNSLVPKFVVMVVTTTDNPRPGYPNHWDCRALILQSPERMDEVGRITAIGGKVGRNYGEWWVVES